VVRGGERVGEREVGESGVVVGRGGPSYRLPLRLLPAPLRPAARPPLVNAISQPTSSVVPYPSYVTTKPPPSVTDSTLAGYHWPSAA
jgi:hypothetical protein